MVLLPFDNLCLAVRVFLEKAYPEGMESVPAWKQDRFRLVVQPERIEEVLPPLPLSRGFCQGSPLQNHLAFRLGSSRFPHLKLCLARLQFEHQMLWVFTVDTHDHMLRLCTEALLVDADAWTALQAANRDLKEEIEHAWESLGIATHVSLLRRQLEPHDSVA